MYSNKAELGNPAFQAHSISINQEEICNKTICFCCYGPDTFKDDTGNLVIQEQSSFCNRCCIWNYLNCLQKAQTYQVTMGGQPTVNIEAANNLSCFSGVFHDVLDPNLGKIGQVGLPCKQTCCKCTTSCPACLMCGVIHNLGCLICLRRPMCQSACSCSTSLFYCCCTGCKFLPTLVMDNNSKVVYKVTAPILQPGVICSQYYCFEACRKINFDIHDERDSRVGEIQYENTAPCICYPCKHKARFTINFNQVSNTNDRALLFAAALSLFNQYIDK
eukprot:TRINITY_DN3300_c0_g1_i1.p1 TRINITY_DN3300_c0_g1~~TRINITY_DN3300_c0_g1_i1.p1  ORF type:complete len:275 (-),score=16.64 TRINITY_DN3300_c0_g1_i1:116-940(-)